MRGTIARRVGAKLECGKCARLGLLVYVSAAALSASFVAAQTEGKSASGFRLETTAFKLGGDIPAKFTCDGEDVSPALIWTEPPAGTKGFALIVKDPDAPGGTFTHWVVIAIKADGRELPEGINKTGNILQCRAGGMQNSNDFGRVGYNGPCPPPGKPHRYFFRLYALDSPLPIGPGRADTRHAVDRAMEGHILAKAEWMGRYHRE